MCGGLCHTGCVCAPDVRRDQPLPRPRAHTDDDPSSPTTQEIISISIHEKQEVFILNSCFALSVLVSLGRSVVPSNLSAAFMTSNPRKMVKEAACATNFMNGPRIIFAICHNAQRKRILALFPSLGQTHMHTPENQYLCIPGLS